VLLVEASTFASRLQQAEYHPARLLVHLSCSGLTWWHLLLGTVL